MTVPWVTMWSGERAGIRTVRRHHGVNWIDYPSALGSGTPLFSEVHARRQVDCMERRLCQVCGTEQPNGAVPWLLNAAFDRLPFATKLAPGALSTTTPPTCESCQAIARIECPHLRPAGESARSLIVRRYRPVGVIGRTYVPREPVQTPVYLPLGHPHLRWMVGSQLMVALEEFKEVRP